MYELVCIILAVLYLPRIIKKSKDDLRSFQHWLRHFKTEDKMEVMISEQNKFVMAAFNMEGNRFYNVNLALVFNDEERGKISDIEEVARECTHDDTCLAFRIASHRNSIQITHLVLEHKGEPIPHIQEVAVVDGNLRSAIIELGKAVLEYCELSGCYESPEDLDDIRLTLNWVNEEPLLKP